MWAAGYQLAVDTQQVGGGIAVLGGVTLAVLSTLRYIKRTEDDVVHNLRDEITRLEVQMVEARTQVVAVRVENARLHRQIEILVKLLRQTGVDIPDDFWA